MRNLRDLNKAVEELEAKVEQLLAKQSPPVQKKPISGAEAMAAVTPQTQKGGDPK